MLLVAGAAAWWVFWSPRVERPSEADGDSFGIGVPSVEDDVTFSFGGMMLCVSGAESAAITGVQAASGTARVTDFAVRRALPPDGEGISWAYGTETQRLSESEFGTGRTVDGRCAEGELSELAVELTRPGPDTARADELLVRWSAGIRSGTVRIPGHFVLCTEPDTSASSCQAIPDKVR